MTCIAGYLGRLPVVFSEELDRIILPFFDDDPHIGLFSFKPGEQMIKLSGLWNAFGKKEVLRGLYLEVSKEKSRVIIGGSVSGKSVILKGIIGVMKPDSDSVFGEDVDITCLKGSKLIEIRKIFSKAAAK